MVKKLLSKLTFCFLTLFLCVACDSGRDLSSVEKEYVGTWKCRESINDDGMNYKSVVTLKLKSNGTFTFSDEGKMDIVHWHNQSKKAVIVSGDVLQDGIYCDFEAEGKWEVSGNSLILNEERDKRNFSVGKSWKYWASWIKMPDSMKEDADDMIDMLNEFYSESQEDFFSRSNIILDKTSNTLKLRDNEGDVREFKLK